MVLQGADDLALRLDRVEVACTVDSPQDSPKQDKQPEDSFVALKVEIFGLLTQCRKDVNERKTILKKKGNNKEVIQLGAQIRAEISDLQTKTRDLEGMMNRQHRMGRKKLPADEIENRWKDVDLLKQHIQQLQQSFRGNVDASFENATWTNPGRTGAMLQEEEDAIKRWEKNDREIDERIDQVGNVVNKLNPLAAQIGLAADKQSTQAKGIKEKADRADDKMAQMNEVIEKMRKQQTKSLWIIRAVLASLLLIATAIFFIVLKKLIYKST